MWLALFLSLMFSRVIYSHWIVLHCWDIWSVYVLIGTCVVFTFWLLWRFAYLIWVPALTPLGYMPSSEITGSGGNSVLNLEELPDCFPFYTTLYCYAPTSSGWGFWFLHVLANNWCFFLFNDSHPWWVWSGSTLWVWWWVCSSSGYSFPVFGTL